MGENYLSVALKGFINDVHPIDEDGWASLADRWQPVEFPRRHIVTWEGSVEKYIYFVSHGVQRIYYVREGKDYILQFSYAPSFTGVIDSFFNEQPSRFFLETVTESKLLRLAKSDWEELIRQNRSIETMVRKFTEIALVGTLDRQLELLAYPMEQRFRVFIRRSPHLLQLVPHKFIASYLGMDPTNFSKLLRQYDWTAE